MSARDKFWFHPIIGLRYETTPQQLRDIIDGIRQMMTGHPSIEPKSVRVRFLRLGSYSLDVEVVAYVLARDWDHFLEVQEQLLFAVTDLVSRAGAEMAFPSQTMYMANAGEPPAAAARAVPAH